MDLQLQGKTALVTGASMGIGRAIAKGLAAEGVALCVAARRRDLLEALREEIVGAGNRAPHIVEADLLRGKRVTSWPSMRTDLRNAGADVVDEAAVTDGNIVTSRNPDDVQAFTEAIIQLIEQSPVRARESSEATA